MTILYGIKRCDTVKKARQWLEKNQINYEFHDLREHGLDESQLVDWEKKASKDQLINRRSTTWKQLSDADRAHFESNSLSARAKQIVLTQPTLLKRPILENGREIIVGFKQDQYARIFN